MKWCHTIFIDLSTGNLRDIALYQINKFFNCSTTLYFYLKLLFTSINLTGVATYLTTLHSCTKDPSHRGSADILGFQNPQFLYYRHTQPRLHEKYSWYIFDLNTALLSFLFSWSSRSAILVVYLGLSSSISDDLNWIKLINDWRIMKIHWSIFIFYSNIFN